MFSEKVKKEDPNACVFVASLCKKVDDDTLKTTVQDHFEKWGSILNVKVLRDWMGRPYAFVQYEEIKAAQTALEEAQGNTLNGRTIRCEPAKVNRTLCLINYNHPFTKQEIEQSAVTSFGDLEDITFSSNDNCHFALVKFCYRNDAIEAFHALRSENCCPSYWHVEWASNFDMTNQVSLYYDYQSIFVGNLPNNVTSSALSDLFSKCGDINFVRIMKKTSKSKSYAFIKFASSLQAFSAIKNYNGAVWQDKILYVSLREFKAKRPQKNPNNISSEFDGCVHYSYFYYLPKNLIPQDYLYESDPYYQVFYTNESHYPFYCVFPYYQYRF